MSPKASASDSEGDRRLRHRATQVKIRTHAARLVRVVFTVLAAILAVGAILVVLRNNANEQNTLVEFTIEVADGVSGPFSLQDGIFAFTGEKAMSRSALTNWGIAAIVYLVVGRVLSNAIAPKGGH